LTRVLSDTTDGEKIEKFDVYRGKFPNPNPDPNHKWLTQPRSKIFAWDPSLL